jgi:hypothetical protein
MGFERKTGFSLIMDSKNNTAVMIKNISGGLGIWSSTKKEGKKIYIQNPSQSPFSKGRNDYYVKSFSSKRMEVILRIIFPPHI